MIPNDPTQILNQLGSYSLHDNREFSTFPLDTPTAFGRLRAGPRSFSFRQELWRNPPRTTIDSHTIIGEQMSGTWNFDERIKNETCSASGCDRNVRECSL